MIEMSLKLKEQSMQFSREIEKKFVLDDISMIEAHREILATLMLKDFIHDTSTDTFWQSDGVDFIRLRENTKELTVKITDGDDIVDRVEENLIVEDYDKAYKWTCALRGDPVGTIEKEFYVYYLNNCIISLYIVKGDDRVFLEVESSDRKVVDEVSSVFEEIFQMEQQYLSLFKLIFGEMEEDDYE